MDSYGLFVYSTFRRKSHGGTVWQPDLPSARYFNACLMQECSNSSALAIELLQSCTDPSISSLVVLLEFLAQSASVSKDPFSNRCWQPLLRAWVSNYICSFLLVVWASPCLKGTQSAVTFSILVTYYTILHNIVSVDVIVNPYFGRGLDYPNSKLRYFLCCGCINPLTKHGEWDHICIPIQLASCECVEMPCYV